MRRRHHPHIGAIGWPLWVIASARMDAMHELTHELVTTLNAEVRHRLVRIFDTFTCGMLAESQRRIVFANQKLARMLGVPRDTLWGKPTHELVPPELRDQLQEESDLADQGDLRARLTALMLRDGTATPVLVMPMSRAEMLRSRDVVRFDLILDLGTVMTAKHTAYHGGAKLRASLARIAIDLQTASLLAGGVPAANPTLQHPDLAELSRREREVLARLVEGQRVPGIAEQLFISQHTVRNHLKSMFRKLDVGSQAELIERVRDIR